MAHNRVIVRQPWQGIGRAVPAKPAAPTGRPMKLSILSALDLLKVAP